MLPSTIPTFMLYGEEPGDAVAEFAHIETIAVRSSVYDWEISPHRHMRCIQVLMVLHGQVEFRCDGAVRTLEAPCFMVVPIGSVHGFRFTPSTMGYVLTLSAGFTRRAERKEDVMLALLTQGGAGTIPPEYEERVAWLCKEMLAVQGDWRAPQPLFLTLAEALARSLPAVQDQEASSPADERLAGFRRLVELHLREHRSVDWYAGQLNVTAKTLTRLCRRVLDCTPTDLIHARLVMEAQRLLTFTNANVVQVADQLGFADSSYFSRFYRRLTGHSPQQDKRGPAGSRIPPR
ncbi:helix-turn-helix domain-containing protein [Novosphingobium panipatense]